MSDAFEVPEPIFNSPFDESAEHWHIVEGETPEKQDAIESGLVKIPQLAIRDSTGADIPGYFNIWHWILPQLTTQERGGKRANPKPEAILKWAHTPIAMLGGLWEELRQDWEFDAQANREPDAQARETETAPSLAIRAGREARRRRALGQCRERRRPLWPLGVSRSEEAERSHCQNRFRD
jgi:hypothetical protein